MNLTAWAQPASPARRSESPTPPATDGRPGGPGPLTPSRGVALFDLDRTLLEGSSLLPLARRLVRDRLVRRRDLVRGAWWQARYRRTGATDDRAAEVRDRALSVVAGLSYAELSSVATEVGSELVPAVRPGLRLLLDQHLRAGDFVVILSAAPQEIVEAVASGLGAHRAVGTLGEVVDGHLTGRLNGPFCYGTAKLTRLAASVGTLDLTTAWAYADSHSDLPVLQAVAHPIPVDPDKPLRQTAQTHNWPILTLR